MKTTATEDDEEMSAWPAMMLLGYVTAPRRVDIGGSSRERAKADVWSIRPPP